MGLINEEEAEELSKHHGQMSNQTGSNPIILEIRIGCVQYDIAKILPCTFLKYLDNILKIAKLQKLSFSYVKSGKFRF